LQAQLAKETFLFVTTLTLLADIPFSSHMVDTSINVN